MKNYVLLLFLMVTSLAGFAQIVVTGTVQSEHGEFIPGITVLLKGSRDKATQGTVTNFDEKFSLELKENSGILIFPFIGIETVEKPFQGNSQLIVVLKSQAIDMEEIVAVGYETQQQVSEVGAIFGTFFLNNNKGLKHKKQLMIKNSTMLNT